jgi:glycine/sarcosine N-methyltransferase
MKLYDQLGEKYDLMIKWKNRLEREAPFFQRLFSENRIKRVIDLGCGTGHHSRLFSNWGCEVTGIDASPELLKVARKNNSDSENAPTFIDGDFSNFSEKVDGEFDAIICLGNTLPHVESKDEMKELLERIIARLKPGGVFVFQNRNYDKLLEKKERFQFPTSCKVADNEQLFFRFNDFEGDKVRFNVVHFTRVGESWIHEVSSVMLSPWKQNDLSVMMKDIGFVAKDFYGDFSGTPYDPESSNDLIGLVRKRQSNI